MFQGSRSSARRLLIGRQLCWLHSADWTIVSNSWSLPHVKLFSLVLSTFYASSIVVLHINPVMCNDTTSSCNICYYSQIWSFVFDKCKNIFENNNYNVCLQYVLQLDYLCKNTTYVYFTQCLVLILLNYNIHI